MALGIDNNINNNKKNNKHGTIEQSTNNTINN